MHANNLRSVQVMKFLIPSLSPCLSNYYSYGSGTAVLENLTSVSVQFMNSNRRQKAFSVSVIIWMQCYHALRCQRHDPICLRGVEIHLHSSENNTLTSLVTIHNLPLLLNLTACDSIPIIVHVQNFNFFLLRKKIQSDHATQSKTVYNLSTNDL